MIVFTFFLNKIEDGGYFLSQTNTIFAGCDHLFIYWSLVMSQGRQAWSWGKNQVEVRSSSPFEPQPYLWGDLMWFSTFPGASVLGSTRAASILSRLPGKDVIGCWFRWGSPAKAADIYQEHQPHVYSCFSALCFATTFALERWAPAVRQRTDSNAERDFQLYYCSHVCAGSSGTLLSIGQREYWEQRRFTLLSSYIM